MRRSRNYTGTYLLPYMLAVHRQVREMPNRTLNDWRARLAAYRAAYKTRRYLSRL